MWKRKTIAIAGVFAVCLIVAAAVTAQQSANYELSWNVLAGGGGGSESANYASQFTIGQPIVGVSESSNYEIEAGFWVGAFTQATPTPTPTPTPSPTPKPDIEVELFAGWNFETWRQDVCVPIRQATQNVIDEDVLNLIARFIAQSQSWLLFDPDAPDALNSLTELCADNIGVINVSANVTWIQDP